MSNPYLGEIKIMGFNFNPRGWAKCDGQILPINQYQSLYSLLGTTYGGDGRTTFGLPDLRGRAPMDFGTGPDGQVALGQKGGVENVILNLAQIPSHRHLVNVNSATGTTDEPSANTYMAGAGSDVYGPYVDPKVKLNDGTSANNGGNQAHKNIQPYQVVNFCIALQGVFPSRN
jgi:microcystin-dependent protein